MFIISIEIIVIIFVIIRSLAFLLSPLFSSIVLILRQVLPHSGKMAARHSSLHPIPQKSWSKENLSFPPPKFQQKFWSGFLQPGFELCPFL